MTAAGLAGVCRAAVRAQPSSNHQPDPSRDKWRWPAPTTSSTEVRAQQRVPLPWPPAARSPPAQRRWHRWAHASQPERAIMPAPPAVAAPGRKPEGGRPCWQMTAFHAGAHTPVSREQPRAPWPPAPSTVLPGRRVREPHRREQNTRQPSTGHVSVRKYQGFILFYKDSPACRLSRKGHTVLERQRESLLQTHT